MSNLLPDFNLPIQSDELVSPETFKGDYTILYFYPRDNTPGCSTEAQEFSAKKGEFEELGVKIYGASADTVKKHCNFIEKKSLTIDLISDPERALIEPLGVWQLKKMAGREYMGIVRTTLVLSPDNEIIKRWDKVRVKGHVEEVYEWIKNTLKEEV